MLDNLDQIADLNPVYFSMHITVNVYLVGLDTIVHS